jgi:ATP synthase protein I
MASDDGAFWSIFSYLLSGLIVWGGIGALINHFLNFRLALPIGLLIGITASFYLIWIRFIRQR